MTTVRYSQVLNKVIEMMEVLGIDLSDPNFKDTPKRYTTFLIHYFPTDEEIEDLLQEYASAIFPTNYEGMVAYSNGLVHGICPHHILIVNYNFDLAYIAKDKAIGVSKLHRIVETLARRPVLQEDLTVHIADTMQRLLGTENVAVKLTGSHSCMRVRGVKSNGKIHTVVIRGKFFSVPEVRQEFYSLVENK
ncbi:MAG: GTP cyclohydrolase I [Gammaproteobacteria bacterium]|nr:GTP cyclohydrolase I [Gammaproteobacteria bacterium]